MNLKYIIQILLVAMLLAATGCKKYLQVQPAGSYTEVQVFASERAVQQALNGLYIELAANELYGAALTQTYLELMAQRYRVTSNGVTFFEQYQQYNYNATQARASFEAVWQKAYHTIMSANLFLEKLDRSVTSQVISEEKGKLMQGEALAIRALIHFDMMRIFGAVYSLGADQPAIPYYTAADAKAQPINTSAQVGAKVLEDLTTAETLLAGDAIKTSGILVNEDFYSGYRNQRLNYYAVKALKARAALWTGKKTEARDAALAVLNEGEKWFPWLPYNAIVGTSTPDRVFSTELLFALYNRALYNNYDNFFNASILDSYILAPDPANLRNTFENNENDFRYTTTWRQTTKPYRTFFKYENISQARPWGFLQPMVRKSELYYILAETETDPVTALGYLNTVRNNRGLPNLAANATLTVELAKEYRKEFYGEGQLFFYYKRTNTPAIPDAMSTGVKTPVYVVPLPLSETTPR